MAQVIVVTSGKGGVGKTTTTLNLGTALALQGARVALVDADIGLRNLDMVMGVEAAVRYTSTDVVRGTCSLEQALVADSRLTHFWLLPASQTEDKNSLEPEQMRKLCWDLKAMVDFVLVDCPAGIERGFDNAVAGADEAILVTTPDVAAVRDADRVIGLLENSTEQRSKLTTVRLLINRMNAGMAKRGACLCEEDIVEILAIPLLGVLPEDKLVVASSNRGEALVLTESAPISPIFRQVARRLLSEELRRRTTGYPKKRLSIASSADAQWLRSIQLSEQQKLALEQKLALHKQQTASGI